MNDEQPQIELPIDPLFIGSPEELLAVIFIALPEPLGVANLSQFTFHEPISPGLIESMLISSATFVSYRADRGEGMYENEIDVGAVREWYPFVTLSASIQFHQVETDLWERTTLLPATHVASAVRDSAATGILPDLTTAMSDSQLSNFRQKSQDVGVVTVAEVVIPLRTLGGPPRLPQDPIEATSSDSLGPDSFEYTVTKFDIVKKRLPQAVDMAVETLQSFQRTYYAISNDAVALVTRERIPTIIPVQLRRLQSERGSYQNWEDGTLQVNWNLRKYWIPSMLTTRMNDRLHSAMPRISRSGAFAAYLDLRRESAWSLASQGDTRMASVLLGAASEALFDELLMHLLWESSAHPEDVAAAWRDSLKLRVKSQFAGKIGGRWDLRAKNPITEWHDQVAQLRHRVVHGLYVPNRVEVETAIKAVDRLASHLVDLLTTGPNIRKYPRTSYVLAGELGLKSRNIVSELIDQLKIDPDQPDWDETYTRWREAVRRCRRDSEHPRIPSESESVLLCVRYPGGRIVWVLHDSENHLAVEVSVTVSEFPEALQSSLSAALSEVAKSSPGHPVSIAVERSRMAGITIVGEWVEEYRHVPMAGVMVNENDLD